MSEEETRAMKENLQKRFMIQISGQNFEYVDPVVDAALKRAVCVAPMVGFKVGTTDYKIDLTTANETAKVYVTADNQETVTATLKAPESRPWASEGSGGNALDMSMMVSEDPEKYSYFPGRGPFACLVVPKELPDDRILTIPGYSESKVKVLPADTPGSRLVVDLDQKGERPATGIWKNELFSYSHWYEAEESVLQQVDTGAIIFRKLQSMD